MIDYHYLNKYVNIIINNFILNKLTIFEHLCHGYMHIACSIKQMKFV